MSEDFEYREEWQYPTNVVFNLTDDCNLACRYCFVQQKPNYVTLDTAKDVVDWMVNNLQIKKERKLINNTQEQKCRLTFFGGEPMLMFEKIIQPLTLYIQEKYKDLFIFGITTNGTLLNKDRIDFLKKYNIRPLLSIDGDEYTQNYNRPCRDNKLNSFDLLIKNIPYLLENFPLTTFRSTIYEPTVKYLFDNYLFAESLGFKNYFAIPDSRHGKWKKENIQILEEQLNLIYNYQLNEYLNNIEPLHFSKSDEMYRYILQKDLNKLQNQVTPMRCGLGTTTISINYKGELYSCQEQDTRDISNELFYLGDIYSGINKNKQNKLLQKYLISNNVKCENEQLCNKCQIFKYCLFYNCPSTNFDLFKDFQTCPEILCLYNQMIYKRSLANMKVLTENNNELFKNYLYDVLNFNPQNKEGESLDAE